MLQQEATFCINEFKMGLAAGEGQICGFGAPLCFFIGRVLFVPFLPKCILTDF